MQKESGAVFMCCYSSLMMQEVIGDRHASCFGHVDEKCVLIQCLSGVVGCGLYASKLPEWNRKMSQNKMELRSGLSPERAAVATFKSILFHFVWFCFCLKKKKSQIIMSFHSTAE